MEKMQSLVNDLIEENGGIYDAQNGDIQLVVKWEKGIFCARLLDNAGHSLYDSCVGNLPLEGYGETIEKAIAELNKMC